MVFIAFRLLVRFQRIVGKSNDKIKKIFVFIAFRLLVRFQLHWAGRIMIVNQEVFIAFRLLVRFQLPGCNPRWCGRDEESSLPFGF